MSRAGIIFGVAGALALAAVGGWGALSLSDAKQAAADATADTAACRQMAGQITALRRTPATTGPSGDDLGAQLERAMTAAEVDPDALARVAPQPPRRAAPGEPARRSTLVALRAVSLRQALSFVSTLAGRGSSLTLETFRLAVPAAEPGGANATAAGDDEWDVELSVSQGVR